MSAPLYNIADWQKKFGHRDTKELEGPLKWVKLPTSTDGMGHSMIRASPHRVELWSAWCLMLQIAARQDLSTRGELSNNGRPLTANDLEIMTGFPERIFERAFPFFSDPKLGWLVAEVCEKSQASAKDATRSEEIRSD